MLIDHERNYSTTNVEPRSQRCTCDKRWWLSMNLFPGEVYYWEEGGNLHKWISFQHLGRGGMSVWYQETTSPSKGLKLVLMFAHKSRANPWETLAFYKTRDLFKYTPLGVIASLNQMDLLWILALALNLNLAVWSPVPDCSSGKCGIFFYTGRQKEHGKGEEEFQKWKGDGEETGDGLNLPRKGTKSCSRV